MNASTSIRHSLRGAAGTLKKWQVIASVIGIAVAGFVISQNTNKHSPASATADRPTPNDDGQQTDVVKLSNEKLQTAQVHASPAQTRQLRNLRTVPGKITYNETQYLEMKSPTAAVVKTVVVNMEQSVKKGAPLAVLLSTEIGMARDAVAQSNADLQLARNESARAQQIADNVNELLDQLKRRPEPAEIEAQFADKPLGEHRQQIIAAYSKLLLAEKLSRGSQSLAENQILSGRVARERSSDREVANAAFATACEQAKFAVVQARDKTRAALQHAERMVAVQQQQLESLGDDTANVENLSPTELGDLNVRAPFDGVIAERWAVPGSQVATGQPLFTLANTASLWVAAEVPERDWKSLDVSQQFDLEIHAPSIVDGQRAARVKFTAGKISPETHTLSIVGELANPAGKFRPGMFVWVSVPIDQPRTVLAVPSTAIVQHEQKRFVFVAADANTFRRVDVTTGAETPDWIEITAGLEAGQNVVDAGTFALKSELLLEHESE